MPMMLVHSIKKCRKCKLNWKTGLKLNCSNYYSFLVFYACTTFAGSKGMALTYFNYILIAVCLRAMSFTPSGLRAMNLLIR